MENRFEYKQEGVIVISIAMTVMYKLQQIAKKRAALPRDANFSTTLQKERAAVEAASGLLVIHRTKMISTQQRVYHLRSTCSCLGPSPWFFLHWK
mmetsp:Transcript_29332/g.61374  ORF Transcript_29332/g.61374 Transcript_29332/m.61374 type:complete len:95 (+) Transcript_29332:1429-1713(+)